MSRPALLALGVGAAVLLGVGALVLFLRPVDEDDTGIIGLLDGNLAEPWCNESGAVCITRESLRFRFALYMLEPNPYFREKGCRVVWLPDFDLRNVGSTGIGAFRSPCSGATFDRLGLRLFGPSPRGLDRFRAEGEEISFKIFVKELRPGPAQDAARTR